ncbi:acyl carrier protein [Rubritalea sp.]|uniref:acyl carrier protein n=1 Tax=Rubritalea sp. TaxID=2109375 RepID=UPI003EF27DA0
MTSSSDLHHQIKEVLVEELMLDETVEEISDAMALMGPDSLGLDSVDALQLVVAIEKHFGLKMSDAEAAKGVLQSVNTIAEAITASKGA